MGVNIYNIEETSITFDIHARHTYDGKIEEIIYHSFFIDFSDFSHISQIGEVPKGYYFSQL